MTEDESRKGVESLAPLRWGHKGGPPEQWVDVASLGKKQCRE
jgi:hypothetical protein